MDDPKVANVTNDEYNTILREREFYGVFKKTDYNCEVRHNPYKVDMANASNVLNECVIFNNRIGQYEVTTDTNLRKISEKLLIVQQDPDINGGELKERFNLTEHQLTEIKNDLKLYLERVLHGFTRDTIYSVLESVLYGLLRILTEPGRLINPKITEIKGNFGLPIKRRYNDCLFFIPPSNSNRTKLYDPEMDKLTDAFSRLSMKDPEIGGNRTHRRSKKPNPRKSKRANRHRHRRTRRR